MVRGTQFPKTDDAHFEGKSLQLSALCSHVLHQEKSLLFDCINNGIRCAIVLCSEKGNWLNTFFGGLSQVLQEAVADLVEVEDVGVVEAIVEAEAVREVDVRDSHFNLDFYSYWFWRQAGVCNREVGAALAAADADAAVLVVVVAIPGDAVGPGVVRRLSSSHTSTRGSS